MFKAFGRWIKAIGYMLTGRMDSARRVLDTNPHVIRAKFDEVVREKTARIHQYKQAVAQLISQEQRKIAKMKELVADVERLENLKRGALAKAKQTTERLKAAGKSTEEIKADEDYKKCLAAYNDFNSTVEEKQARINELETDIEGYTKTIADHKIQLQSLLREIEKIKTEAADTVADVITAQQEKDIADTLSGIAQDGTAEELQNLRKLRQEAKAEAKISKELAGTDTKAQENEFLEYASQSVASDEFDALLGLGDEVESAPAAAEKTSLPE